MRRSDAPKTTRRFRVGPFILSIIAVGVLHRLALFLRQLPDLDRLIALNPDWLTWQFLSIPAMRDHLALSLLYLQQQPPVPILLLGLLLKVTSWPHGVAYCLILFQATLSIASSILMFQILSRHLNRPLLSWGVAMLFLLSLDLILLEYNSFGQTFYENITMVWLLLAVWLYERLLTDKRVRYSLWLGVVVALLAMSRATFSYFFPVPLICLLMINLPTRRRHLVAYLLPIIVLQGAWTGKKALIYNTFDLSTSSWKGTNFGMGLKFSGNGEVFRQFILANPQDYPEWFVRMNLELGLVHWRSPYQAYLPAEVQAQDRAINERLSWQNTRENSQGQRVVSDLYMQAYVRFARAHPDIVFRKFWASYAIFWQPIRNYSSQWLDLFYVRPVIWNSFDFPRTIRLLFDGGIPEPQYILQQTVRGSPVRATATDAAVKWIGLSTIPTVLLMVNIACIHLALPILLIYGGYSRYRGRPAPVPAGLYFMSLAILYVTLVVNLPECCENVRFRLDVEPLIWITSALCLQSIAVMIRGRLGRTTPASPA